MSVRSFGRSNTQTLSSLSTASPVTPPIFHLFGRGLGQSGSNLNFGADSSCAPSGTLTINMPRPANRASVRPFEWLRVSMGTYYTRMGYDRRANGQVALGRPILQDACALRKGM